MSELRKDPVSGNWVIIASERGKRPSDYAEPNDSKKGGFCPFCYGNENKTPPEVLAYRTPGLAANQSGWSVRVVPNKFAAVQVGGELCPQGDNLCQTMNAIGIHEVVIENPEHDTTLGHLSQAQAESVVRALVQRYRDISQDPRIGYIQIFKNSGGVAGASLEHPHWQIIAIPLVPRVVE
ncbi:MAG: galactose-1-phosphate uridylyltransferase, partial [Carboxydocellales bacterium]